MKEDISSEQETWLPPSSSSDTRPTVVGIGASAGGLAALKRLFDLIPSDSGLVFVVVVHLSPEHKSHLPDLLQPSVRFPVRQVTETVPLEANNVYVIPPNANLSAIDTHLRLSKLEELRRERAPIDHFFRTLAGTHDGHSIGVILTGTGSDGTLGLKEIKAKGGLILVQDPNDAEFDGMPQSAIATGLVDRVLPLSEIPEALLRLAQVGPRIALSGNGKEPAPPEQVVLPKVLTILKTRTERDFSRYKHATLLRRIARRMQLNYIEDVEHYLEKLREHSEEARALADDLLITVTSFFRDPDVFSKLEKEVVPQLFEGKGSKDSLRIWSVGCATGEEAYSLAILLLEEAARRDSPPRIQIFASDLHKRSLQGAREGLYPGDIETDVSAERLKRFFQKENGGYRICKEVRDTVVFAPHNLLGDPPFSRLHLITCRNLLIYLDRTVQREVVDLFHYALCPNGYLLLGSAETIDASELFRSEDKKLCIYRKRNVPVPEPRLPVFPLTRVRVPGEPPFKGENTSETISYHSLHQNLLERYAPPSILVGPDNRLVHLSEHAGRYLTHPGGEVTLSVLRLVRDELRIELQGLLQSAREKKELADSKPIAVRFNGHTAPVVMHVRPTQESEQEGFVLVIFEEHQPQPEQTPSVPAHPFVPREAGQETTRVAELEEELNVARQRLQTTIEEFETSREEMKASNEEMQSTNEELRSTMEELETSKEELQSINEELQTVNQENRHKVEELSQLSGDLQNLLSATDIATLFLDRELRIMRFTPRLAELFNIRVTDRGRPISDLTHRLGYPQLREDAQAVLDRLIPIEREIQDDGGRWYLTRVMPYRSTEDRIEGMVITFTEITTRKSAEVAFRESEERQAFLLKLSDKLQALTDPVGIQQTAMQMLGEQLGLSRAFYFRVKREDDGWAHVVESEYRRDAGALSIIGNHPLRRVGSWLLDGLIQGKVLDVPDVTALAGLTPEELASYQMLGVAAFVNLPLLRNGEFSAGITAHDSVPRVWRPAEIVLLRQVAERTWDAIERARAEEALRVSEEKYRDLFDRVDEGYCIIQMLYDASGKPADWRFLEVNSAFEKQTGFVNATGRNIRDIQPNIEPQWMEIYGRVAETGESLRFEQDSPVLGGMVFDLYAFRVGKPAERKVAVLFKNITERRKRELNSALLDQVSKDFATLTTPDDIMAAVGARMGEFLQLSACVFADVDDDRNLVTVHHGWMKENVPTLKQTFRHEDYLSDDFKRAGRSGETFIVRDTKKDPRANAEKYAALEIGSFVLVPFHWRGKWTAFIAASSTEPRDWRPDEIELLQEISNRVFPRLERARAEEALRDSEERFRTLANTASAMIWQNDARGENVFINQYFLDYTGMAPEQIRGEGWHALVHPEDAPAYIASYLEAVRERRPWQNRNRIRRHNGEWHWFANFAQPLLGHDSRYLGHVGVSVDINELVEADEALRVNEKRLRGQNQAFQMAINGAPLQDSLGVLARLISEETAGSARTAFYLADEEIACLHPIVGAGDMPESYTSLIDRFPIGHESLACGLASASGQTVLTSDVFEEPLWKPWLHLAKDYDFRGCWSFPIETRDRKPIGTLAMYFREPSEATPRDLALAQMVTQNAAIIISRHTEAQERARAEDTLRQSEERFRLLVANVREYALVQTDQEGLVTSWNPGAERLFNYSAEQMLGRDFSILLTPEDSDAGVFRQELAKVAAGERNEDARWVVRKDASRFWARWISEPIRDETGKFHGVAKIMRDETERQQAADLLQQSLEEKEELLKEVHHRVKNNLQVIVSLLNMQTAQIQDDRVLALFQETRNRVLAVSSIHELLYRAESFAGIVLADYARQLAPGLVRFYDLEQRVQVKVFGDGATLELERAVPYGMLLNELVSNACKHAFPSPEEGTITISIQPTDGEIELVVADTGRGLPNGFNYQGASSLGLKLVRGLVRQLRGTLDIQSKPGTTVTVRFPSATGTEQEE